MDTVTTTAGRARPWNKGKLLGQKPPRRLKEIWALRHAFAATHESDADLPEELGISGRFSSYWVTQNLKAPSGISGSR